MRSCFIFTSKLLLFSFCSWHHIYFVHFFAFINLWLQLRLLKLYFVRSQSLREDIRFLCDKQNFGRFWIEKQSDLKSLHVAIDVFRSLPSTSITYVRNMQCGALICIEMKRITAIACTFYQYPYSISFNLIFFFFVFSDENHTVTKVSLFWFFENSQSLKIITFLPCL